MDDRKVTVDEIFSLLDEMETSTNERFPAHKVFHRSLRTRELEQRSIENSISITARNESGKLVGFLKLVTDHSYMFYILDVMVAPNSRGNGVARHMIDEAIQYGKSQGFIKIFLTALPGKESYYESFGFSEGMSPVLTIRGEDYV
jgi:ribosomal protein S18 acetylase RimI-like enzyme